jgi:hypothetical protein
MGALLGVVIARPMLRRGRQARWRWRDRSHLFSGVLLDEVHTGDGDLGLVRPGAAEVPLCAGQDALERDEITFDRIQRWRSNLRTSADVTVSRIGPMAS